jgi:hypothetical protein
MWYERRVSYRGRKIAVKHYRAAMRRKTRRRVYNYPLYKGGNLNHSSRVIKEGLTINDFGYAGGVTEDESVAKTFSKFRTEGPYKLKYLHPDFTKSLPVVITLDDELKKKMRPVDYKKVDLEKDNKTLEYLMDMPLEVLDDDEKPPKAVEFEDQKEWISDKPINLREHVKKIDVYITPAFVNLLSKREGIKKEEALRRVISEVPLALRESKIPNERVKIHLLQRDKILDRPKTHYPLKKNKPKPIIYHGKPVTHISSNMETLKEGFTERNRGYGISFARVPDEEMSVPELKERKGTPARVYANVRGKGLDYKNPSHKKYIDKIYDKEYEKCQEARRCGKPSPQIRVSDRLREQGYDFVNNWQSLGEAPELHVVNPKAIKIKRIVPLSKKEIEEFNLDGD